MYTEGNIIYFDPFYFHDGDSKPKYFLVIKKTDTDAILASLPSSQVHLPAALPKSHGCINIDDSGISCYIFCRNVPVTTNGWSFQKDTFLYGNWIGDYSISTLQEKYKIEGIEYKIIGSLTHNELQNIKDCFRSSAVVKRKYKKLL